jgi:hypothetical protein
MIGSALLVIWGLGAMLVLSWAMRATRGWVEQSAGAAAALLWPIVVCVLLSLIFLDWRAARRLKGRVL